MSRQNDSSTEIITQIPLTELSPFPDHPFIVRDDEAMKETVQSVKEHGVHVPIIVRPREEGGYEIVAGHAMSQKVTAFIQRLLNIKCTVLLSLRCLRQITCGISEKQMPNPLVIPFNTETVQNTFAKFRCKLLFCPVNPTAPKP